MTYNCSFPSFPFTETLINSRCPSVCKRVVCNFPVWKEEGYRVKPRREFWSNHETCECYWYRLLVEITSPIRDYYQRRNGNNLFTFKRPHVSMYRHIRVWIEWFFGVWSWDLLIGIRVGKIVSISFFIFRKEPKRSDKWESWWKVQIEENG